MWQALSHPGAAAVYVLVFLGSPFTFGTKTAGPNDYANGLEKLPALSLGLGMGGLLGPATPDLRSLRLEQTLSSQLAWRGFALVDVVNGSCKRRSLDHDRTIGIWT